MMTLSFRWKFCHVYAESSFKLLLDWYTYYINAHLKVLLDCECIGIQWGVIDIYATTLWECRDLIFVIILYEMHAFLLVYRDISNVVYLFQPVGEWNKMHAIWTNPAASTSLRLKQKKTSRNLLVNSPIHFTMWTDCEWNILLVLAFLGKEDTSEGAKHENCEGVIRPGGLLPTCSLQWLVLTYGTLDEMSSCTRVHGYTIAHGAVWHCFGLLYNIMNSGSGHIQKYDTFRVFYVLEASLHRPFCQAECPDDLGELSLVRWSYWNHDVNC